MPNLANQVSQQATPFFNAMGQLVKSVGGDKGGDNSTNSSEMQSNTTTSVGKNSTSFFDKMNQTISKTTKITDQTKEVFTNVSGAATTLGQSSESNLRQNLLNKTVKKIYEIKKPDSNTDFKSQLRDFLGGPLGDKLT
ncbi:MAG: hypothetical protein EBU90_11855 [Proteobacteria bacterium]|nr:hypothetical protein [Pseudomonadota bacterium]